MKDGHRGQRPMRYRHCDQRQCLKQTVLHRLRHCQCVNVSFLMVMDQTINKSAPDYLAPYYDAARVQHAGFRSLLWASRETQAARFNAICRLANPRGKSLLDVGCGRADLSDYCIAHHIAPADYIGIEAVEPLAKMARAKA